jgi:hypothetical protein
MEEYRVEAARDVLRQALRHEAQWPAPVTRLAGGAAGSSREFLLGEDDWSEFLRHPVCKHMFVRGRWGKPQDAEREALSPARSAAAARPRRRPAVGAPGLTEQLPRLSTNMLGMAYYLTRLTASAAASCRPPSSRSAAGTARWLPLRVRRCRGRRTSSSTCRKCSRSSTTSSRTRCPSAA